MKLHNCPMAINENMKQFTCVYFGGKSDGEWWSIECNGFESPDDAQKHGNHMMSVPNVFGFAVIIHDDNWWNVRDDLSILPPSGYSISCSSDKFSIKKPMRIVEVAS
tara:strand:+ start:10169 stop:10489 length:321 start_codon:yes stop_codon:yes gene_type:complete